mgnify:CR=1 FL=1
MTENNINRQLTPAEGCAIANKDETIFANTVFLAKEDSADNYHEVTIEYAKSKIEENNEKNENEDLDGNNILKL